MLEQVLNFLAPFVLPILIILIVVMVLPLVSGYVVLMERKVMADVQARLGPMRVGPHGLLQPIADALKLLIKEDIIPEESDRFIFWVAPLISVTAAMVAFSALVWAPGSPTILGHSSKVAVADLNIGLLFILAISSMGIFGIVLGGWASNNHYSLLGALRGSAQLVSYEVAAGLSLVSAVLLAGSLSMGRIMDVQAHSGWWYIFLMPVAFFIYLVASIAETNRAPFDLPEAESELVAGYMTEYSGFRWAIYFLAEYCNMIVVAAIATTLFLGGWMRPFHTTSAFDFLDYLPPVLLAGIGAYCFYRIPKLREKPHKAVMPLFGLLMFALAALMALPLFPVAIGDTGYKFMDARQYVHGVFWFLLKIALYLYAFMWIRFTFPRYRFDQLMQLGWHFLIPVSIVNLFAVATGVLLARPAEQGGLGWPLWVSLLAANAATLLVALWLGQLSARREERAALRTHAAD
jgi:NADH-quinone oxidoreductase subunit H